MGRVRHQRAPFENELQVVARALGVLEAGGLERREARQAHAAARPVIARRKELPEGPVHRGRDLPVLRLELPGGARRRPRKAGAAGQAPERPWVVRQRVGLELVSHGRHVEGVEQMAAHVAVQPLPADVLLRRRRAGHRVGRHLEPRLLGVDLAVPDLDEAGVVAHHHLEGAVLLRPQESGLLCGLAHVVTRLDIALLGVGVPLVGAYWMRRRHQGA